MILNRCNVVQSDHDKSWWVWWNVGGGLQKTAYGKTREEAIQNASQQGFDPNWLNREKPWLLEGEAEDEVPF
jgi:hypothetical protein